MFIKKIIPQFLILAYHWILARLAALVYGFPSEKMIVIGVTGTAGKSTVVNLIAQILTEAGYKVGLTTTFNFKIGDQEWENQKKMTMLGRFSLQKLLKRMVNQGCDYAVIETSSQGMVQFRHRGINYDLGVFTGLAREHLEAHGGWEKYRQAKEKLFQHLSQSKLKQIKGKTIKKTGVVNLDDKTKDYFLKYKLAQKYGYGLKEHYSEEGIKILKPSKIILYPYGSEFVLQEKKFSLNLLGRFNIANALAAISVAQAQNISLSVCQKALAQVKQMPGRMEIVIKNPFTVIVDYAHTPDSLEKVYQTIVRHQNSPKQKLICVLGATGGGRDKWKRPVLGALAEKYGDKIIITNEDPYDEDPDKIMEEIIKGIKNSEKIFKIFDRQQAIAKAISLAQPQDTIIITGKGCEPWIMQAQGKKIPWDDRKIVKEVFKK